MSMWSRRTAYVFTLLLGASGCREKVVPQPEPTPSIAPTPVASASASAGSEARRAPWRTTPNERFEVLRKQCDDGVVKGCDDALVLSLEADQSYGSKPFTKANVDSLPDVAKKACDAGSKLACAFRRRGELEKLIDLAKPRHDPLFIELCDAAGDPLCFIYRNGSALGAEYDSEAACERGVATECLVIAGSIVYDSPWIKGDPAIYAKRACDLYIQTCHHAIQTLIMRNHPERRSSKVVKEMFERIAMEQSKRCAEGHPTCGAAAHAMLELGRDVGDVRKYAEAGIEDDDRLAHYVLARLADEGLGQPADPATAVMHYKMCMVDWGDENVCYARLAALYEAGRGVPKDTKQAFRFALVGRKWGFATSSMLRYFRLIHESSPPLSRDEVIKAAKSECPEKTDPRCPTLWKLIEEGKPIPEALP